MVELEQGRRVVDSRSPKSPVATSGTIWSHGRGLGGDGLQVYEKTKPPAAFARLQTVALTAPRKNSGVFVAVVFQAFAVLVLGHFGAAFLFDGSHVFLLGV